MFIDKVVHDAILTGEIATRGDVSLVGSGRGDDDARRPGQGTGPLIDNRGEEGFGEVEEEVVAEEEAEGAGGGFGG